MKHIFIVVGFLLLIMTSFGQSKEYRKALNWIEKKNIALDSPIAPEGFDHYTDCESHHVYKKISGDTIVFYVWSSRIAQDLNKFKETVESVDFNVFEYPTKIQKNGTIMVTHLKEEMFLWRNDTLHLFDKFDEKATDEHIKTTKAFLLGEISEEEFKRKADENHQIDYGFNPKFKIVYYKGIFNNSTTYQFDEDENFRREVVHLLDNWEQDGKKCFRINLETRTNGEYVFSEDMTFLEIENCQITEGRK